MKFRKHNKCNGTIVKIRRDLFESIELFGQNDSLSKLLISIDEITLHHSVETSYFCKKCGKIWNNFGPKKKELYFEELEQEKDKL